MSKIDRHSDFTPSPLGAATALPHARPRLRRRGARRSTRDRERDQARRNRSATRQARPLPKASCVLERRESRDRGPKPGIDRNGRKRRTETFRSPPLRDQQPKAAIWASAAFLSNRSPERVSQTFHSSPASSAKSLNSALRYGGRTKSLHRHIGCKLTGATAPLSRERGSVLSTPPTTRARVTKLSPSLSK
jgi:hypothetical protein